MKDKGGRRQLADRRHFSYCEHFPERRATRFRRSGSDRRRLPGEPPRRVLEKRSPLPGNGWIMV